MGGRSSSATAFGIPQTAAPITSRAATAFGIPQTVAHRDAARMESLFSAATAFGIPQTVAQGFESVRLGLGELQQPSAFRRRLHRVRCKNRPGRALRW